MRQTWVFHLSACPLVCWVWCASQWSLELPCSGNMSVGFWKVKIILAWWMKPHLKAVDSYSHTTRAISELTRAVIYVNQAWDPASPARTVHRKDCSWKKLGCPLPHQFQVLWPTHWTYRNDYWVILVFSFRSWLSFLIYLTLFPGLEVTPLWHWLSSSDFPL